jgi:peptidoglycan/LPS O-acetylase OafA/YrhL
VPTETLPSSPNGASPSGRLGWLDLLRGVAAIVVALHHATYYFIPRMRAHMIDLFDPGLYGVLVFFLVSGYIVPASLERHGRVRGFWISRLTRIYPLLLLASALTVLPTVLGVRDLRAGLGAYEPVTAVLAHLTMLQDVLAVPNVIGVLWTLSYEMLFYLLVVALFVVGAHRRSASVAVTLVIAAVLAGGVLPMAALSRSVGVWQVVTLTVLVLAAAITAAVSSHPVVRTVGGIAGGVWALVLVLANGRVGPWQGLVILAVMFTGTALYRADQGQIRRRTAMVSAGVVLTGAIVAGAWHAGVAMWPWQAEQFRVYWGGSVLLAALTFATGWALRHRRIPRWLTALGTVSFSLYLLHPVLLLAYDQFLGRPDHDDLVGVTVFTLALVAVSFLTYRYVELPVQRLGRRLNRRPGPVAPRPAAPSVPAPLDLLPE